MEFVVVDSRDVDVDTRDQLRQLWHRAFGARFDSHDADHAFGGVHVLAYDDVDNVLIAHASAVPREVRFGGGAWQTIGYVEAVAVEPARQGNGVGRQIMQVLQKNIASRWALVMLSTGRHSFYEALGWQRWRGKSYTRTASGVVEDDEHGGLMILVNRGAAPPDLTGSVTCLDRPGDAW